MTFTHLPVGKLVRIACPRCGLLSAVGEVACDYCGFAFGHFNSEQRDAALAAAISGAWEFKGWRWRVINRPFIGGGIAGFLLVCTTVIVGLLGGFAIGFGILKTLQSIGYSGTVIVSAAIGFPAIVLALLWFKLTVRLFYRVHTALQFRRAPAAI
jgi:hypothetical protein